MINKGKLITALALFVGFGGVHPLISAVRSQEVVFDSHGFENERVDLASEEWIPFHRSSSPSVEIVEFEFEGGLEHALLGRRTNSGGWTALSLQLDPPQSRIAIEFRFAFAGTPGRSLNLWTHEPRGDDASQFNICIQNGALMQFDGRSRSWMEITREITPSADPSNPVWHTFRAIVGSDSPGIDFWVSKANESELPAEPITRAAYRTDLPIEAIDFVSGTRIANDAWYLIDDLVIHGGDEIPRPNSPAELQGTVEIWKGEFPTDIDEIPFADDVKHQTIHRATEDGYKFLHGAAITHYQGELFAHWANSPINENGPQETLKGRRSSDGGMSWSELETIGPGFDNEERHSHGVFLVANDELWTFCSRFGVGENATRFPGLKAEAYRLNVENGTWESHGIAMENCWPYDEPVLMSNGHYITGGQDKDGLPVVAICRRDELTKWETIAIPYDPRLKPSFAETTVWAEGNNVTAIIRGGGGVAWVSYSADFGQTWTTAAPSNFRMPRAKAYLAKLSTEQTYLVANLENRHTLAIAVTEPGEQEFSRLYRIRSGPSEPPRFPGRAKSKQWSYPYAHEHDGKLYVVYSIGKEDCGLSIIPISSLQ